jgi:hypothetical protein
MIGEPGQFVLLADSQLLFPGKHSTDFLAWLRTRVAGRQGIYIGAANGDEPAYFQLAHDAFSALGAQLRWQKHGSHEHQSEPRAEAVESADFFVLAGGDVALGWRYLQREEVQAALQQARQKGALFIGVSAGAMHLAHALSVTSPVPASFLGWLSAVVAVHEERDAWPTLQHWKQSACKLMPLVTIPMGGALVVSQGQRWQAGKGCDWHSQDQQPQDQQPTQQKQPLAWLTPSV